MSMHLRIPIAALSFSAAAFAALVAHESYTGEAVIPTKNDRWTVGFGSTFNEDGSAVVAGDTITPPRAVRRSVSHIAKDERGLKRCVTQALSQVEYDTLVDFSYQFGVKAACGSSMVKAINEGSYFAACNAYVKYRRSGGFDCSTPGNKVCSGVWDRALGRQAKCLQAQ